MSFGVERLKCSGYLRNVCWCCCCGRLSPRHLTCKVRPHSTPAARATRRTHRLHAAPVSNPCKTRTSVAVGNWVNESHGQHPSLTCLKPFAFLLWLSRLPPTNFPPMMRIFRVAGRLRVSPEFFPLEKS